MSQYECKQINKAKAVETWLKSRTAAAQKELKCAHLENPSIIFREPFRSGEDMICNGFVSFTVRVVDRAPEFLTDKDKSAYWGLLKNVAKERFGIQVDPSKETCYASYNFDEPSEAELYALTENKKAIIENGLRKIHDFVSWVRSCPRRYNRLVVEEHQNALHTFLKLAGA